MNSLISWRGLLLAAGLILAGSAILHVIAYPNLGSAVRSAHLETWAPVLTGLWMMFALHLTLIAGFIVAAAVRPSLASDSSLFLCALLLAGDTALLGGFLGLFPGTVLVGISTALVIIARTIRGPVGVT
jgi:hypothetical protein